MGKIPEAQYEVMVEYMEKHGDLNTQLYWVGPDERLQSLKRWNELIEILNKFPGGEVKSSGKWRKAWSDLKHNVQRKVDKKEEDGPNGVTVLTALDKRVVEIMGYTPKKSNSKPKSDDSDAPLKKLEDSDGSSSSPQPSGYAAADKKIKSLRRIKTRTSSSSSRDSSEEGKRAAKPKKKKRKSIPKKSQDTKNFSDRFIDYERQKNKVAHEKEMARISENDKLLTVVEKMVDGLETLVPSVQTFLNQNDESRS